MTILKILVIRRDNIGDLVCTTPLIAALRQHFPAARIDALVNSYNAPVLAENRDVDHIYVYTKAKHRAAGTTAFSVYWTRLKTILSMRAVGYDYAVLANVSCMERPIRWAKYVGAKHIVGFVEKGNSLATRIDCPVPLPDSALHEVERLMRLMRPFEAESTEIPPAHVGVQVAAVLKMQKHFASYGLMPGSGLIGFHISSRLPSQRWPTHRFIELAHRLNEEIPAPIALFWSPGKSDNPHHPGDDEKAEEILAGCQGLPVFPIQTDILSELIAGLSCIDLLICSDGGAMHVAAGLGKPIVCMFGDSNAGNWHPWGVRHIVLQAGSRDVTDIAVDEVYSAFKRLKSGDVIQEESAQARDHQNPL